MKYWRFTIDLRDVDATYTAVIFSLFNWDNSKMMRCVKQVEREMLRDWVSRARDFFCDSAYPKLGKAVEVYAKDLSRDLDLPNSVHRWFKSPLIEANPMLVIDSLHTNIPWDLLLVPSDDKRREFEYLGNRFALGHQVPTEDSSYFFSTRSSARPRRSRKDRSEPIFLHVMANPFNDLHCVQQESDCLRNLVDQTKWLRYNAIQDATWDDLVRFIRAAEQDIYYFHYSGHVRPKKGLLLCASERKRPREKLFSIQAIRSRLAAANLRIAFLNGCDERYMAEESGDPASWNSYVHANVANAFLEAGAEGVTAPRNRIFDEDALEAAHEIWAAVFAGKTLGEAVQAFRRKKNKETQDHISGYSYVVYGNPAVIALPEKPVTATATLHDVIESGDARASDDPFEQWRVLASAESGKEIAPCHVFAAFTRQWIVGKPFFDQMGQVYIKTLIQLRQALGVSERNTPDCTEKTCTLTSAAAEVFSLAATMLQEDSDPDYCLFRALAQEPDSLIKRALEKLNAGRNLNSLQELWRMAEMWRHNGSPIPAAAVLPDGRLSSDRFLPDIRFIDVSKDHSLPPVNEIKNGQLFAGLLAAGGRAGDWWLKENLPLPARPSWLGKALDCAALAEGGLEVILCAVMNMEFEEASRVNEPRFIEAICRDVPLKWDEMQQSYRSALRAAGADPTSFKKTCERLLRQSRGW